MYLGIDLHKRYAQVAVMDDAGEIVEEVRVENANLKDLAQRYAGAQAVIEATSNYYHVHDTLSEYLDVIVAHPGKLTHIAHSDKKTDRVDAKELARLLRLNAVPESYVPSDETGSAEDGAGRVGIFSMKRGHNRSRTLNGCGRLTGRSRLRNRW